MPRPKSKEQWERWYSGNKARVAERNAARFQKNKIDPAWRAKRDAWVLEFHRRRPLYYMVKRAKRRAKDIGVPFDLDDQAIFMPVVCPVLGIILDYSEKGKGNVQPNSPSLDQIIPRGGYTMDNVRIISHRANTLKSDATLEEVRLILADMEKIFV